MTTITRTSELFAFTRPDMNGATTPVDIPVRSRAPMAYGGYNSLKMKYTRAGIRNIFRKESQITVGPWDFRMSHTDVISVVRKLRKRSSIMR